MTFLESEVNPHVIEEFREAYERAQIRKNRNMWRSLVVIGVVCLIAGLWAGK